MTKQEQSWIYRSTIVTVLLMVFLLYLISNYSPLDHQTAGVSLDNDDLQVLDFSSATDSVDLQIPLSLPLE